jgi:hypothetical protein
VHEVDTAPDLEGDRGQVVLVLYINLGAEKVVELRVAIKRSAGEIGLNDFPGFKDILVGRPFVFHLEGAPPSNLTSGSRYGNNAGVPPVWKKRTPSSLRKYLLLTKSINAAIAFPV